MIATLRLSKCPLERRRVDECYFYSSFFLNALVSSPGFLDAAVPDDDRNEEWNRNFIQGFNSVRKWTKEDINIFKKIFLFVPVNLDTHWSLVIVCNPGNISTVVDDDDREIPAFVCMDSLKLHPLKRICQILRKYLEKQWECEKIQLKTSHPLSKKDTIPVRMTAQSFPDVHPKVPSQKNRYDCGVFLLKYAGWFFNEYIEGRPISLTHKSVERQLKGIVGTNMFR